MEPITFTAHEYTHQPKRPDWFWALGIIAVAGAATSLIFGNVLFALLILVGAFVVSIFAHKQPAQFAFEISEKGIFVGNKVYPYQTLESFWVSEINPDKPLLTIESKRLLMPHITIPLDTTDPKAVRAFLAKHLKEEEHGHSLSEQIAEWLGF